MAWERFKWHHAVSVVIDALQWGFTVVWFAVSGLVSGFQAVPLLYVDRVDSSTKMQSVRENKKENAGSGIMHVFGDLYITFLESEAAESMSQNILLGKCVLVQMSACANSGPSFVPSSLTEIFRFDDMLRTTLRHNPGHKMVICTNVDAYVQTKTVFLTGCHLMMTHGFSFRQTSEAFKHLKGFLPSFDENQLSLPCCWMALYRAKCLGWVNFGDIFDFGPEDSIFIEEYMHYARQIRPPFRFHLHSMHHLTAAIPSQPDQRLRLHRRARPLHPLPGAEGRPCERRHVGRRGRRPPLQRRLLRRAAAGFRSHPGPPAPVT